MATIIELGDGGFIAGDPPTVLPYGQHWCEWCGGDGLEYDVDVELTICGGCGGCGGLCTEECFGCEDHPFIGPLLPR